MAPEVTSFKAPDLVHRNVRAEATATVRDQDQDPDTLLVEWFEQDGACPPRAVALRPGRTGTAGTTFPLSTEHAAPFCVWVLVTDRHGARAMADKLVRVENRPPNAMLEIEEAHPRAAAGNPTSFALFSDLRLIVRAEDPDGDKLRQVWDPVKLPDARTADPVPCPGGTTGDDTRRCYRLLAAGEHRFQVRVDDFNPDGRIVATLAVTARPDAPPCIVGDRADPPVGFTVHRTAPQPPMIAGDSATFTIIRVEDDGDPLPAPIDRISRPTFVWSRRLNGVGEFQRLANPVSTYQLRAADARAGDVWEVRVEYHDREMRTAEWSQCPPQELACAFDKGTTCYQRIGWRVEYR